MRKKSISIIVIMGMLFLLIGGYQLPTLITAMEDYYLKSNRKSFVIEKIELKTSEIDFFQELYRFSVSIMNEKYMQKIKNESEDGWIYRQTKEIIEIFLDKLQVEMAYEFEKMQVSSFLLTDFETEQVYPIWYCKAIDTQQKEYHFWIDEITGNILAFQIPTDRLFVEKASFAEYIKRIANYYGFEHYEGRFKEYNEKGSLKSWDGILAVIPQQGKEHIAFPLYQDKDFIRFNIYNEMVNSVTDIEFYDKQVSE